VLNAYLAATQNLLQSPGAPTTLYSTANITTWVNTARGQLAGEAECVRRIATVTTTVGTRNYNFSSITIGDTSVAGVLHVRRISYNVGTGQKWFRPRAWEWFDLFHLNNPVPVNGPPEVWSQYGQGSAPSGTGSGASGSFYLDPPPDLVYTLNCDCVCLPIALVDDTTVEALPYPWTDAVPYFAAYLALLSSQTSARVADAERMFGYYTTFMQRARQFSNPSVNRGQYEQSPDPTSMTRLGLVQKGNG
jgi:hypothetical protein